MNHIEGKIEIMTKISAIPQAVFDEKTKIKTFKIKQGNFDVIVNLPEKMFKRIEDGAASFELWVCAINGKIKSIIGNEIEICEPAVQVFESKKKPKSESPQAQQNNKHQHNNKKPPINPNKIEKWKRQESESQQKQLEKKPLEIKTIQ